MGFFDGLTIIISLLALIFSIATFVLSLHHEKKIDTLKAFNVLQNDALDRINMYTKEDVIKIAVDEHSEEYKQLSALMARIEHFCVGVNGGVYNKKIVSRLAGVYFIGLYKKLCPLIEHKRCINTIDRYYDEFENVVRDLQNEYGELEHRRKSE